MSFSLAALYLAIAGSLPSRDLLLVAVSAVTPDITLTTGCRPPRSHCTADNHTSHFQLASRLVNVLTRAPGTSVFDYLFREATFFLSFISSGSIDVVTARLHGITTTFHFLPTHTAAHTVVRVNFASLYIL